MARAGRRRHKLTIEQTTPTRSGSGQDVESWGTYKIVWAELMPVRAGERLGSRQVHADADYLASCPYQDAPAAAPGMRVSYGSRVFDILGAQADNKTRELVLSLRERNL